MTSAKDLRALSDAELNAMYEDLRKEVFVMRSQKALRKDDVKHHELREKRKSIARVLTIQTERKA